MPQLALRGVKTFWNGYRMVSKMAGDCFLQSLFLVAASLHPQNSGGVLFFQVALFSFLSITAIIQLAGPYILRFNLSLRFQVPRKTPYALYAAKTGF